MHGIKIGVCKQTQSRIPEPKVQVDTVKRRLGRPNARDMHAAAFYSMSVLKEHWFKEI